MNSIIVNCRALGTISSDCYLRHLCFDVLYADHVVVWDSLFLQIAIRFFFEMLGYLVQYPLGFSGSMLTMG